ncbi:MAG: hypothetical protein K2L17_13480, partial [Muribaculaceae bacterium]|nr:hypothetical protein [Muribaculaceae bacterium]
TVFLFREKMVDYMIPTRKSKFKGWLKPRVLTSRSYYHFKDKYGLDSVSDESQHHFSWSDWIGILPSITVPNKLTTNKSGTDTIRGKYSPTEIWQRDKDRINLEINVLADKSSRKWVPNLSNFFKNDLNFERFMLFYSFDNVINNLISPQELTGYSFNIKSEGRGHSMFRFNRLDEPFFVSTSADVYILDKELIKTKEAKKWERQTFDVDEIGILEPEDAPELSQQILALIERVEKLNKDEVKLALIPDQRMKSDKIGGRNFKIGRRALLMLKQATGISKYNTRKNLKRQWNEFRKEVRRKNENKRN